MIFYINMLYNNFAIDLFFLCLQFLRDFQKDRVTIEISKFRNVCHLWFKRFKINKDIEICSLASCNLYLYYVYYAWNISKTCKYAFPVTLTLTNPKWMKLVTVATKVIGIILMVGNIIRCEYQSPEKVWWKFDMVCAMTL